MREEDLDAVASPSRADVPTIFATFDDGSAQPDRESIVRDQRRGH